MDIIRFTTSSGYIDITSNDLSANTCYMSDAELIAYAASYFSKHYKNNDVQCVEIIAR